MTSLIKPVDPTHTTWTHLTDSLIETFSVCTVPYWQLGPSPHQVYATLEPCHQPENHDSSYDATGCHFASVQLATSQAQVLCRWRANLMTLLPLISWNDELISWCLPHWKWRRFQPVSLVWVTFIMNPVSTTLFSAVPAVMLSIIFSQQRCNTNRRTTPSIIRIRTPNIHVDWKCSAA